MKLHIIFALKYNKLQLLLLDKINDITSKILGGTSTPLPYRPGERRARAYNGSLGAVPPAVSKGSGSRGQVQGVRVQTPLKLNTFLCCDMPEMAQSCYFYALCYGH